MLFLRHEKLLVLQALNAKIEKAGGEKSVDSMTQLNALESRLSSATTKADSKHQSLEEKVAWWQL